MAKYNLISKGSTFLLALATVFLVGEPQNLQAQETDSNLTIEEIALEGEVDEIRNYYSFIIKEDQLIGGDSLLVINATGEPIPDEDERVVVTGMVRPFIKSEFERDYDLTWNLDIQEQIEAEYSEKPVLVLDSIYTSAKE